jgi:hypothetical protein
MRSRAWCGIVLLATAVGSILAQGPAGSNDTPPNPDLLLVQAKDKDKDTPKKPPDKPKDADKPKTPEPPPAPTPPAAPDAFAQGPTRGGEAPGRGYNPHMVGDYQGLFARMLVTMPVEQTINTVQLVPRTFTRIRTVLVQGPGGVLVPVRVPVRLTVNVPVPTTVVRTVNVTTPVAVPITGLGSFKIAENESPMPGDRAFVTYNHFRHIRGPALADAAPAARMTTFNGQPAVVTENRPAAPFVNANREVFGVERSFYDGAFSLGLRLPLSEQTGDGSFADVGDVTGIFKYALLSDPETGSVVSAGLAVTAPTGPSIRTTAGDLHSTLFQPFLGGRLSDGTFFVQAFTSVSVPTKSDFPTLLFNDVSLGYVVYRGEPTAPITTVAPVVEAHLTTPLTGRGADAPLVAPDLLVLVAGVQFGVYGPSTLTLGVGAPVTGPRLFDVEGIVQLNLRF